VNEAQYRCLDKAALALALQDSRRRTLALFGAYEQALGPALAVPSAPELNPPLWELGHVGWFADWWITRNPQRHLGLQADPEVARARARQAARGIEADGLYNSSRVAHARRWHLPLPDAAATRADLQASLADTLAWLDHAPDHDDGLYFFRLALFHEDMHAEAAVYMAQTLGLDPLDELSLGPSQAHTPAPPIPPLLAVPGTEVTLGHQGPGFAFDNELGPHRVAVPAFHIDTHPVSWAQFLPFVDSGAYAQSRFWTPQGLAWRNACGTGVPRFLRRTALGWEQQRWGRWQTLDPQAPAQHLSWFEAQAWCHWADRRLPTEAEWLAASLHSGFRWGQVWEWTASAFAPFAGFQAHPYRDYSQPWFDGRPVLKGASVATHPRLRYRQYRNYYTPERNDLLVGFRSVLA